MLNENHRRRLSVTFQHVDELLSDAVQVLSGADADSPFARYAPDATPVQRRVFEEYVRRVRVLMLKAMERMGVPHGRPICGTVRAALGSLLFAEVAIEEIEPERMRGYGAMDPEVVRELTETCAELLAVLRQVARYLSVGSGADLQARLARLEKQGGELTLREGVVLVDTPGLGSLATSGGAEALAYLPRADLGVVLTDAGGVLAPEDVSVVEALLRAGARAMVVVSKADLLSPADRDRVADYVRRHVGSQVGCEVPVHVVSVVSAEARLAETWISDQVLPLFQAQRELRAVSLRRKVGALREAVLAALRGRAGRGGRAVTAGGVEHDQAERALRRIASVMEETGRDCEDTARLLAEATDGVIRKAAWEMAACGDLGGAPDCVARLATACAAEVHAKLLALIETARSEMSRALQVASTALPEAASEAGELPEPRGLPTIDVSAVSQRVSLQPAFLGFLGAAWRRSSLAQQLQEQVAGPLREVFTFHGRRLGGWSREALLELQKAFDARAARHHSALQGMGGAEGDAAALERDIEALSRWGEEVPA